jgi:hypothetical protein
MPDPLPQTPVPTELVITSSAPNGAASIHIMPNDHKTHLHSTVCYVGALEEICAHASALKKSMPLFQPLKDGPMERETDSLHFLNLTFAAPAPALVLWKLGHLGHILPAELEKGLFDIVEFERALLGGSNPQLKALLVEGHIAARPLLRLVPKAIENPANSLTRR